MFIIYFMIFKRNRHRHRQELDGEDCRRWSLLGLNIGYPWLAPNTCYIIFDISLYVPYMIERS